MAINFPASPSTNDIHVDGANRWQWNGTSWTRIGGVSSDADVINSTNDNSTTTLYPVMTSGTGSQNAKVATSANKNLKFNAAEGDLTVGGDISGVNANLTGILTASQYNSITTPGVNVTGVATALQLKGPLTSSGINVTGVSTFSGNVTVGGVLTYEDVKNVDSIGLGTFRNGVVVKTGTATTALIVEGDARVTGILTVGTGSLVITDKDINATGIITGANFKSGTTNVHNVGVEAAGINVLGADTPIGTGATVYNSGLIVSKKGAEFQGVVTASSFKGSGADLTDVISGVGIDTSGTVVGYAATIIHFRGPGVSTAYYSATTGIGTVYFQGGGGSASVSISESAPSSPSAGDMWWDSDVGNLQIYYTDANSSQWVTANNSGPTGAQGVQGAQGATGAQGHQGVQGAVGAQGAQGHQGVQGAQGHQGRQGSVGIASLTISTSAPSSPAQGDMWWDSDDSTLGLYYNDGSSSQWVNINHGPSGPQGAQGAQGHQGVQGATGSTTTINNNANNRIITGSGTANTLNGNTYATWNGNNLALRGGEGENCTIELASDEGDDNADFWRMKAHASDNALAIDHYATGSWLEKVRIDSSGHIHTGYATNVTGADHVNILSADGGGVSVAQNNAGNATSGTTIGSYSFQGYHQGGATFASAEARISAIAAANHTGSSAATDLAFYTKPAATGPGSSPTERLRILSTGGVRLIKSDGNGNFTISRNASVTTTDQPIGVIDFASNTQHTVQARVMGKTLGTGNVGGDLVVETRASGGSLDERFRITGDGKFGFGTATPSYPMHLVGDGMAIDRNAGDPYLNLRTSDDTKVALYGGATTGFRVFTKPSGGSLAERLRIDTEGSLSYRNRSGYWQITTIHNGNGSGNWYSGSGAQRIYPAYYDKNTGYGVFYLQFEPSVSHSGYQNPQFVIRGGDYLQSGGLITVNANNRTNSPNNATFRCYHGQFSWQAYNDGDTDQASGMREMSRNVEHKTATIGNSSLSVDYIASNDSRYSTNAEPLLDQKTYLKIGINDGNVSNPWQGHTLFCKFETFTNAEKEWYAYMVYNW